MDHLLKVKKKYTKEYDSRYIYQNQLDKSCFLHEMNYQDFKYLPRRTPSDKMLSDKAFNTVKNPKDDEYQRGLASMVYKSFDKKSSGKVIKNKVTQNKELAEELHKPIIRKFEKWKIHSSFIYNIWVADLEDMQIINKYNKGLRFLLWVIDIYSKYAWLFL